MTAQLLQLNHNPNQREKKVSNSSSVVTNVHHPRDTHLGCQQRLDSLGQILGVDNAIGFQIHRVLGGNPRVRIQCDDFGAPGRLDAGNIVLLGWFAQADGDKSQVLHSVGRRQTQKFSDRFGRLTDFITRQRIQRMDAAAAAACR